MKVKIRFQWNQSNQKRRSRLYFNGTRAKIPPIDGESSHDLLRTPEKRNDYYKEIEENYHVTDKTLTNLNNTRLSLPSNKVQC
ncbi:hypothetical protein CHS0354_041421 [Potamilus streckersoni]|uniref:Uncharacterized protein n=1 Tax=Potamilus streckersoni TaxID=2493646 RepID=A0AAE0TB26_9BIVA|nr:hypothetical protein CHS0354_041421 [Potamilus streckersoni]